MALRKPLVLKGGIPQQLSASDSLAGVREALSAARTYYVRGDGNDNNTGLANSAAGAFLTIQKAVDVACALDLRLYDITIMVGAGTWTSPVILKNVVGAGRIIIRGINANTTSTFVNVSGAAFSGEFSGIYELQYMKIQATLYGISTSPGGGTIKFGNIDFGACTEQINVGFGGFIEAVSNYTISGGSQCHIASYDGGHIRVQNKTVTLVGNPAIGGSFISASRNGTVLLNGNTWSGSATGKRYNIELAGGVLAFGATFPGSTAGTLTAQGWLA